MLIKMKIFFLKSSKKTCFPHLCIHFLDNMYIHVIYFAGSIDHQMKFTNIYAGWPGCVHDARVLRNSTLYTEAEAGNLVLVDHYILADSAYPLRNWLITPFKNLGNLTPQQVRFNKTVKCTTSCRTCFWPFKRTVSSTAGHSVTQLHRNLPNDFGCLHIT